MKRIILSIFILVLGMQLSKAQSIFIKSGRNLTNYKLRKADKMCQNNDYS